MSRGLGKVEKAALETIEHDLAKPLDSIAVTLRIHGDEATESQYSSTRRALTKLCKKGLITHMGDGWRFGRSHYMLPDEGKAYLEKRDRDVTAARAMFGLR
jgi:DNA-binding PadR family transcriptional regulator